MEKLVYFFLAISSLDVSTAVMKTAEEVKTTVVSYYGDRFNGRKTASGEIFRSQELTAAHKTLPFGTKVKVTNTKTGKSVVVKVNDRGPYVKGRTLDLSKGAFKEIADVKHGTATVKYEILD